MTRAMDRKALLTVMALLCCAALAIPSAAVAAKKKKKVRKGPSFVDITKTVGAPIPDAIGGPGGQVGVLSSTTDVSGRPFRNKRIRDVDVTVQVTGLGPGANAIGDITARLISPSGASTILFGTGLGPGNLLGPLTLSDESLLILSSEFPPDDTTTLTAPWQGTARPDGNPLWKLDNGLVSGTWTLRLIDTAPTDISSLISWRLLVAIGNPFLNKR